MSESMVVAAKDEGGGGSSTTMNVDISKIIKPSTEDWPTVASEYKILEQIGQGAFAKVYKAFCEKKKINVAIKVMDLEKITSSFEDIRAEVQTMKMTNHRNILTCYCSFVHKDQLWLVMKLMDKGSCLHVMNLLKRKGLGEGLKEDFVAIILKEALKGLQYFHENGQIHRDIKAGNILLDSKGHVLIADFGVSGWMMEAGDRRKNRQTFVGTPCWMSPEVMEQVHGYDYKADIWSFGITALELAKGFAPYARFQPMKVLLLTLQEDPPSLRSYEDEEGGHVFSRHFKDMVRLCLQKDPSKRPNTTTLLKHNFFKKAKEPSYLASELLSLVDDIGESILTTSRAASDSSKVPGGSSTIAEAVAMNLPTTMTESTSDNDRSAVAGKLTTTASTSSDGGKYVPGTTWVFDDDSAQGTTTAEDMDDFASQFTESTGGEKYRTDDAAE